MGALRPKYLLCGYMEPLGIRPCPAICDRGDELANLKRRAPNPKL